MAQTIERTVGSPTARAAAFGRFAEDGDVERIALVLVAGATILGGLLRFWNLGHLGLTADEGFMALGVAAILEHGVPVLDHGLPYARALLFQYLQAGAAQLLGEGPLALRVPAALFGTFCIPLTYLLGRRLVGIPAACLCAVIVALSAWEIELSRYARFYTAFQALWLLAAISFVEGYLRDVRAQRILFFALLFVGLWFHELMVLCGTWFLALALLGEKPLRERVRYLALTLLAGSFRFVHEFTAARLRSTWDTTSEAELGISRLPGKYEGIASVLPVELPDFGNLRSGFEAAPVVVSLVVGAACLAAYAIAKRRSAAAGGAAGTGPATVRDPVGTPVRLAIGIGVLLAALGNLSGATILVALAFIASRGSASTAVRAALVAMACLGGFWLYLQLDIRNVSLRNALAGLFEYPQLGGHLVYWLVNGWPILSIAFAAGCVLTIGQAARERTVGPASLLLALLFLPLLAMGVLKALWFEARYIFHLYPSILLLALAPLGHPGLTGRLAPVVRQLPRATRIAAATIAALAFAALTQDANLRKSWDVVTREYGDRKDPIKSVISWPLEWDYHPDLEAAAAYVAEHMAEDDIVVAVGPPHVAASTKYYLGRIDYQFGNPADEVEPRIDSQGKAYNPVADATIIDSTRALRDIVEAADRESTVWIVGSARLFDPANWVVRDAGDTYLQELGKTPAFVARDRITSVVRVPPVQE